MQETNDAFDKLLRTMDRAILEERIFGVIMIALLLLIHILLDIKLGCK